MNFLTNLLFHLFYLQEYLETCMNKLEDLFEQHQRLCYSVNITAQTIPQTNNINCNSGSTNTNTSANTTIINNNNNNNNTSNCSVGSNCSSNASSLETTPTKQPNIEITSKSQSGTPTDVQDVTF